MGVCDGWISRGTVGGQCHGRRSTETVGRLSKKKILAEKPIRDAGA